jgi:hypothetical protein
MGRHLDEKHMRTDLAMRAARATPPKPTGAGFDGVELEEEKIEEVTITRSMLKRRRREKGAGLRDYVTVGNPPPGATRPPFSRGREILAESFEAWRS